MGSAHLPCHLADLGKGRPIPLLVDQEFRQDYGTTPNALLAARYGVATGTILKWARQLRLRKDPEIAERDVYGRARR